MSYLKKLIKALLPVIVATLASYGVILLSGLIYNLLGFTNLDFFISHILPYITIVTYLLLILFLVKKYPPQITRPKAYFPYLSLGISMAIFLNMLIFKMIPPIPATLSLSLPLNILNSGLIGPIYEEVLFRHILYNRLQKFNSPQKALLLTTVAFSLIHLSPIKIVYAFLLGLILNIIYQKDKNILSPILIHSSANITSIFLFEYNTYLLILSLINLILSAISLHKIKKK